MGEAEDIASRSWSNFDIDEYPRCDSRCPHETEWSRRAKIPDWIGWMKNDLRTHCTLPSGHAGRHMGCDDSEWD